MLYHAYMHNSICTSHYPHPSSLTSSECMPIQITFRRLLFVPHLLALFVIFFWGIQGTLPAQTYRSERFQDGRSLRQGKFLISAGWSALGLGYDISPLGIAMNPSAAPTPNNPSDGLLGLSGSFGIAPVVDIGVEVCGTLGGPSLALWGKAGLLPYSSPWQIAVQPTIGYSWGERRVNVIDVLQPSRLVRGNLFVIDVAIPISYDLDSTWTLMLTPHVMTTAYNVGVGSDTIAPNGLRVSTLTETKAGGLFYGITIGAKAVRTAPEWWKFLLQVPFLASGSFQISLNWHQDGTPSYSFGYQHLFPSFGTLLTTVTQEEMVGIESDRRQKDSIVALQKRQLELERTRSARALSAEIVKVSTRSDSGREELNPTLNIEEFAATERRPLLATVFFEHNSFVLPARYKRIRPADRTSFRLENVAHLRMVEMYRNILNIIGKRLTDKPEAQLTLIGYTSGIAEEAHNRALAERRAGAVAEYLADVWKISPARLTVLAASTADTLLSTDTAGIRRVEIRSADPDILRDIESNDVQRVVLPQTIVFGLDIAAGVGVKQWNIELTQLDGTEVRTLKMDNSTRSDLTEYVWNITENPASMPNSSENIVARLEVTDVTNRVAESALALIPVEYLSLEKKRRSGQIDVAVETDYYWLFGQNGASPLKDETLKALAREEKKRSSLTVTTQNILSETQLQLLGESLQKNALTFAPLRLRKAALPAQSTPEERIYARAVKFEYRTPEKMKQ